MTYIEILVTVALNENFMTKKKVQEKTNYLLFRDTLFVLHKFLISINVGKKIYQSKTVVLFLAKKKYVYVGQINTSGESKNYKLLLAPF